MRARMIRGTDRPLLIPRFIVASAIDGCERILKLLHITTAVIVR